MTYFDDGDVRLYCADALEALREMPDQSVHMACTSPPFFGLRDYGTGTWEGGDEDCDHLREMRKHIAGCLACGVPMEERTPGCRHCDDRHRKRKIHGTPAGRHYREPALTKAHGEQVEEAIRVYRDECGKCGARRIDGQIGLESSPDEWAARLVDVFREVRRVLCDDGTLWVECGDSYANNHPNPTTDGSQWEKSGLAGIGSEKYRQTLEGGTGRVMPKGGPGLKNKDLIGQPWLLAFALRADGWYLRSCIIWAKPNCMPESVTDRPTTAHSYVFLFSKRPRYFYDAESLREPNSPNAHARRKDGALTEKQAHYVDQPGNGGQGGLGALHLNDATAGKNARSVWTISTEPNALAICRVCDAFWQGGAPREHCGQPVVQHFAAFPRELVRRMILAGTSERGVCAECGAPWVREVETHGESTYARILRESGKTYQELKAEAEANGITPGNVGNTHDPGSRGTYYASRAKTTLGWAPTCNHEAACVPATVLDPFAGSGTSLLVARQHGRHAIGIELNERYAAMCKARMSQLSLLA